MISDGNRSFYVATTAEERVYLIDEFGRIERKMVIFIEPHEKEQAMDTMTRLRYNENCLSLKVVSDDGENNWGSR